jgi:hypothetical protein
MIHQRTRIATSRIELGGLNLRHLVLYSRKLLVSNARSQSYERILRCYGIPKALSCASGLVLSAALLSGSARADTALVFTGGELGLSQDMRGWAFTDRTITVKSLGWWDSGDHGLAVSHQVGIWNAAGNLLLSATVPAERPIRWSAIFGSFRCCPATRLWNRAITWSPV